MLRVRNKLTVIVKRLKKTATGIYGIGWLIVHTALLKGSKVGSNAILDYQLPILSSHSFAIK